MATERKYEVKIDLPERIQIDVPLHENPKPRGVRECSSATQTRLQDFSDCKPDYISESDSTSSLMVDDSHSNTCGYNCTENYM